MNILIAEDDKYSAILLKEFLKGDNVNVQHVSAGDTAVDFCKDNPVDLVFMDIKLPNIDGFEATKLIKKSKPDLIVIAQTACAISNEIEKIKYCCFDAYISKPYNKEDILNKVTELLGSRLEFINSRT